MITKFSGKIRFRIQGQEAQPKWVQDAIKRGLNSPDGPPESLRFQCRIATDCHDNFRDVKLDNGTTLTLHPKAKPQFGRNRDGHAYLTVTLTHIETGESYRFRWLGKNVPLAMQQTAVKHDEGKRVGAKTVVLDVDRAEITPIHQVYGHPHRSQRDTRAERLSAAKSATKISRGRRHCARLTAADLPA